MSISRKIAAGASATMVAAACFATAGAGIGATAASAAPSHSSHCPSTKGKYPPGKCTLSFNRSTYRQREDVTYLTGQVFKPGESVSGTLKCPKSKGFKAVSKTLATHHARSGGAVFGTFTLPKKTPKTCTLTLHGAHSGITLSGSFHVKK